jgi:uncharacterized OsmC-like protein
MKAQPQLAATRINGVGIATLLDKVETIRTDAELARYRFSARNQWLDGGHTRTTVKDFYGAGAEQTDRARPFVVESDIPGFFDGDDRAMDPLEHLLAALAASVTTTLVWHAAARGIHIDGIETSIEGDIDLHGCLGLGRAANVGYESIRIIVKVEAAAAKAELDKLVELAARYSPALGTIGGSTQVEVRRERPNPR